jgi:ribonuclease PH
MTREDGRAADELRPIHIEKAFLRNAHGSALVTWGHTRVLCTAMFSAGVPLFLENTDRGWLTAEYAMLPASTPQRKPRDRQRPDGRSTEIGRLIGRALRCVCDLTAIPGFTVTVDCDVIDADGGTRTAGITGAYVALRECEARMEAEGLLLKPLLWDGVVAVSCGVVEGEPLLDLAYREDSRADADLNVVFSHSGGLIEVQGTGEKRPISPDEFAALMEYAAAGAEQIQKIQKAALGL